jgi:hypothetical protein
MSRRTGPWPALFACLVAAAFLPAQEPLPLALAKTTPLTSVAQDWVSSEIRCGPDGDLFLYETLDDEASTSYVLRVSRDGKDVRRIEPGTVSELQGLSDWGPFAVGDRGEVYLAAIRTKGEDEAFVAAVVATFDPDGKFVSAPRLEYPIEPRAIAAFGSGDLLIAGWDRSESSRGRELPFTGIFNRRGQLMARLRLPDDTAASKKGDKPPPDSERSAAQQSVSMSRAELGPDGNVYLARGTAQGPIYVINQGGEVVRTLRLSPPPSYQLRAVRSSGGGMVALYVGAQSDPQKETPAVLRVVDALTGAKMREYAWTLARGEAFACSTGDSFTFIRPGKNHVLELVVAEGR